MFATAINSTGLVVFLGLSIWLSIIDWRKHRLPNRLVAAAGICGLTSHFAQTVVGADSDPNLEPFIRSIVTAVVCFALFLALHLASKTKSGTGMGAGDVKLAGVLGLYLGWISIDTAVLGIAAGFVLGAVFSLSMMAFRRANHRSRVAFGPWMLIGAWLAIVPATFG
jgi:leader peptidase (prepilin peptidase)/N-methyltransferase